MRARPVRVFISYAHADRAVVELLLDHLGGLANDDRVELFDDRQLVGGEEWDERLRDELARAELVLFVVTAKFLRSSYCAKVELKETIRRREAEGVVVMPVIAETCLWQTLPLARLQALPKDDRLKLRPLNKWGGDTDVALTQIAEHVLTNVERLAKATSADSGPTPPPPALRGWRQPEAPDRCLGREEDLARLVAALTAEPCRPIAVYGGAGMGKSTLTRAAANHPAVVARFGDRRAWVALDRAADAAGMMAALLDGLALPTGAEPWPAIAGELAAAPALLVLDNLETPWAPHRRAVEELLAKLARVPGLALMVSLRSGAPPSRPDWGTRLEVLRLMAPADRALLLAIASDVPPGDPHLADVLTALDGWALAIELFAEQAAGLGGLDLPWSLWRERHRKLIAESGGNADPLAVSLATSLESPLLKLEPPFPADAAKRLYTLMGRLPDGLARRDAEVLLPGCGDAAAVGLLRVRLVHPDDERLRMLVPIRDHAARTRPLPEDMSAVRAHFLGLADTLRQYLSGSICGNELGHLRKELVNLEAITAEILDVSVKGDTDNQRREFCGLAIAIGDARRQLGQLELAAQNYLRARDLLLALALRNPTGALQQHDLGLIWDRLGSVRRFQNDLSGAVEAYSAAKNIAERLAVTDPSNADWQRDLSVSWSKLGDVRRDQGDLPGALQAHTAAMHIAERLAVTDPGNAKWQGDLSISWSKLGDVRSAQGDLPGALQAYTEANDLAERLAATDSSNAKWQRDLSLTWSKLGDVRSAQGDLPGALQAYTAAKDIRDRLATADPDDAECQRDLIVSHWRLADLLGQTPDQAAEAAAHWTQALAIARALADTGRLAPTDADFVETLEQRLAATREDPPSEP